MPSEVRPPIVWSFFSGAMGLDLGFENAGLSASLCVEIAPKSCETIRHNRPDVCLLPTSITKLTAADLRTASGYTGDVDLMIGGPPCQSFSTGGNRVGLADPRGNLIYEYLRVIRDVRPRYFLLENVANLVTAAIKHRPIKDRPGKRWNLSSYHAGNGSSEENAAPLEQEEMSGTAIRKLIKDIQTLGYGINFGVLDAAEYGAAQHRMRFILLACRDGSIAPLPQPTYGPNSKSRRAFVTLRQVIHDLQDSPGPHSNYGESISNFYALVPPGGNWRDLPKDLQVEALGQAAYEAGGGKTGFYRRLSWDAPAPTITGKANRKAGGLCHPSSIRPLSVHECARIQGFPDDWKFSGSMHDAYLQIGNAVPVTLANAVACSLKGHLKETRDDTVPNYGETNRLLDAATQKLRGAAKNKRQKATTSLCSAQLSFIEDDL